MALQLKENQIIECALDSLSTIMGLPQKEIEEFLKASHFYNWSNDSFTRGAYSYVPVNGVRAQKELAAPVEDTLFFAGEATNTDGHWGTVDGAMATGLRAAQQYLASRKNRKVQRI
jgi:monoamine oxidase